MGKHVFFEEELLKDSIVSLKNTGRTQRKHLRIESATMRTTTQPKRRE
jgi:hypothetical protein